MRAGGTLRLVGGIAVGWSVGAAVLAPETPLAADLLVALVVALTWLRPLAGLVTVLALAPAGLLIAAAPVHMAEILGWAFLSAWLLAIWRPLGAPDVPRRVMVPAALYAACAFASWLGLTVAGAVGVEASALPLFLARSLRPGHLLFTAPEPETWTWLQAAAGLALFMAAATVTRTDERAHQLVAYVGLAAATAMAMATLADVALQWNEHGVPFLLRYVHGERFALHIPDLNAAGSVYVLGMLVAIAFSVADPRRRLLCAGAAAVMTPALWLTGSRSAALGALLVGATLIPMARYRGTARVMRSAAVVLMIGAVLVAGATVSSAGRQAEQGSAAQSLRLRSHFLVTSARMLASAPAFGVGIGRYHERSNAFMPDELRAVYSHENAHNYFAQQFAELGIVGGLLFVWLVSAGLLHGWRALRTYVGNAALLALFAGCAGYLLTCITGHPLLVPEAALPFWIMFGAVVAAGPVPSTRSGRTTAIVVVVIAVLGTGVALHARAYVRPSHPPPERGFYGMETGADRRQFVWMTQRGVWHISSHPGFLIIPVRAPEAPVTSRPFVVSVEIGGRRRGTYEVPAGAWTDITIAVRDRSARPFRRVDLWANQVWATRDPATGRDTGPRSIMVGEVRWSPAGAR